MILVDFVVWPITALSKTIDFASFPQHGACKRCKEIACVCQSIFMLGHEETGVMQRKRPVLFDKIALYG